jgi:hypothetical protein
LAGFSNIGALMPNEFITTDGGVDGMASKHSTLPTSVALIPHALDDHTDVDLTVLSTNDVLAFDGAMWVPTGPATVASSIDLDDLQDVSSSGANTDDVLSWDGAAWVPVTPSSLMAHVVLEDLSDIVLTGTTTNDLLMFDGANWINKTPADLLVILALTLDDLADVSASSPNTNELLGWNGSAWVPMTATSVVQNATLNLDDIDDVNAPAPAANQVLGWDGAEWIPTTVNSGIVEPLSLMRGTITGAGVISQGSGFGVVAAGSGIYQVTYDTPFSAVPTVVVTGQRSSGAPTTLLVAPIVYNMTVSGFTVQTTTWNGASFIFADEPWVFIVAGDP